MEILGMIVVGFIVGLIARAVKPGNDRMGIIMTTLLGIAGAFLAGFLGQAMGLYTTGEPAGWIASVIGAVLLLFIVGMLRGRSHHRVR
ncbi:MAG TPA: GlsB/YeaQ/YmgE family stress response membrane protein [Ramlibacter sp.]